MRYQGGKSRIAVPISGIINQFAVNRGGTRPFISLFCGSCSIESKVRGFSRVICADKHAYLIAMFQGVQNGYTLPDNVSETEYHYICSHKEENPVLAGFVGFGCSFGGKWFNGYARSNDRTNYAMQSKRSLLKDMQTLMTAEFICSDYRHTPIPINAVVYADPPYNGTTGYCNEKFDSEEFWRYMRLMAQTGHTVLISEQSAPWDFVPIWAKPFTRTLDRNKNNQFQVVERLYTYNYGGLL